MELKEGLWPSGSVPPLPPYDNEQHADTLARSTLVDFCKYTIYFLASMLLVFRVFPAVVVIFSVNYYARNDPLVKLDRRAAELMRLTSNTTVQAVSSSVLLTAGVGGPDQSELLRICVEK